MAASWRFASSLLAFAAAESIGCDGTSTLFTVQIESSNNLETLSYFVSLFFRDVVIDACDGLFSLASFFRSQFPKSTVWSPGKCRTTAITAASVTVSQSVKFTEVAFGNPLTSSESAAGVFQAEARPGIKRKLSLSATTVVPLVRQTTGATERIDFDVRCEIKHIQSQDTSTTQDLDGRVNARSGSANTSCKLGL